jgi:hypothetical protein
MNLLKKLLTKKLAMHLLAFAFLVVLFAPTFANAQSIAPTHQCVEYPAGSGTYVLDDGSGTPCVQVISTEKGLNFRIPSFSEILTFIIRAIFLFGGLAALFFLLLGAFSWITSGGEKDAISKAQAKIQAAILGVIMIAVVLAIAVTLEQVIFARKICFGLSCPLTIPSILK